MEDERGNRPDSHGYRAESKAEDLGQRRKVLSGVRGWAAVSIPRLLAVVLLLGPVLPGVVAGQPFTMTDPAKVTAVAVSMNATGELEGASASIEVRASPNGSGHVFMDTRPLSGTDLQGSARIASRVASGLTGAGLQSHDLFYTIRSDSPVISGPSAGAIMTLAATVALENTRSAGDEDPWEIREDVIATGTINPDGSIGPVGGILAKAQAAKQAGASTFLVPAGESNYTPRLPQERQAHGEGPVNVPAYCETELNITCRSVAAIEGLVEQATGRELPEPELGEPPTTALYAEELGPRTREIVDRSERVYETWEKANDTDMSDRARDIVMTSLESAANRHREAVQLWEEDRSYSAASKAFESAIRENHARMLIEYHEQGTPTSFLERTVDHAEEDVEEARSAARSAEVPGLHSLYTVGAAQERVSDAEQRIEQARRALQGTGSAEQILLQSAWALERSRTVHWWLELSEPFGEGPDLPEEPEHLADEFVNLARELIAYSESVSAGQQSTQPAQDALEAAKRDQDRGFHAAALVEAAEAQVLASISLEARESEPSPSKVNASRHQAAVSIQEARGLDVEPVLPIAMFEFATTSEDPSVQLRFYRTANVLAGISSVLTASEDPNPSRFIDPSEHGSQDERGRHVGQISASQAGVMGWAIVGMLTALALGSLGFAIARSKE